MKSQKHRLSNHRKQEVSMFDVTSTSMSKGQKHRHRKQKKNRKTSYTCHWRQCSGSQLAERLHHEGLQLMETFRKWRTTALPSMTSTRCFPSFYRWKIKLLFLFLRLLFQILPRNHNCNVLNVFLIVLSHNNARSENGQRTVREQSENILTVLSTGSAKDCGG